MKNKLTEIPIEKRIKLSEYIVKIKEKRELGFNQLSLKAGLNPSVLNRILKTETKIINPYQLKKIASALRIDYKELYKMVGYLEEEEFKGGIEINESEAEYTDVKIIKLPVYGVASAGKGYLNLETILKYKKVIDDGFSSDSFLVEVNGDSMATLINDKDIVVVDPQLNDYVAGKIYVITYNDETYIKQVQCPKKNIIVLKSLNSNYEDKYIIDEEIKQVKVEGRVVKVITEKKL